MHALIIEDEPMARKSLERLLGAYCPDITVIGATSGVQDSVAWLSDPAHRPDLIFMDVELADGKCFEIFRQIDVPAPVIMTTAYDNYAIKAFEVNSIDYLLKPIEPAALLRAVERCRSKVPALDVGKLLGALADRSEKVYKERFLMRYGDHIVPVKTSDILCFYSEDKDNHVVCRDRTVYLLDGSLDAAAADLDPDRFFKISRSCILAKDAVGRVTRLAGGRLEVQLDTAGTPSGPDRNSKKTRIPDIIVARSRTDEFLIWLEK